MITVTQAVKDIVDLDITAQQAMQRGYLNYSMYAATIHTTVEHYCKKTVKIPTIIVTLTRIAADYITYQQEKTLSIDDLVLKSPLTEITYKKTPQLLTQLAQYTQPITDRDFFTSTIGIDEVTIICSESIVPPIIQNFSSYYKVMLNNLAGITIRFNQEYITIPNVLFTFMSRIASKHINIIEVISTYTELTFIIARDDIIAASHALDYFFKKNNG